MTERKQGVAASPPGHQGFAPQPATPSSQSGVPNAGALRVWWVPQVPMKAFEVAVPDLATAAVVLDVLADYDAFQLKNNVKGDYCNTGGLTILRENGEWEDWEDPDTFADFDEWRDEHLSRTRTNGWGRSLSDIESPAPKGGDAQ